MYLKNRWTNLRYNLHDNSANNNEQSVEVADWLQYQHSVMTEINYN